MSRRQGLLLLFMFAFALRAGVVVALHDPEHPPYTYEHGEIASNLLAGNGFSVRFLGVEGPTSQQAPLYPGLLALAYLVLGAGSGASLLCMHFVQAAVGGLTSVLLALLAWSLLPRRPNLGWTAGLIVAVNPVQIYMAVHIQVAIWATLLLVLAAVLASWTGVSKGKHTLLGATCGVMLLAEPILALAIPMLVWLDVRTLPGWSARRRACTALVLCLGAVLAPWLLRNYLVHGEPVFVKSSFGYAFWQGNNAVSLGTDKLPKPSVEALRRDHDGTLAGAHRAMSHARHETLYIDDVVLTPADCRLLHSLGEPARSRLLMRRALDELSWTRYASLCTQRLRYFMTFDATNPKSANLLYRAATVLWLASLGMGLVVLRRDWRRLWPLAGIFLVVLLFHVLTITSPRFRMPVETLSYLWSAGAVTAIWSAIRLNRRSRSACDVEFLPRAPHRQVAFRQHARRQIETPATR